MNTEKQAALAAIDEKKELVAQVADAIWDYAELSMQEVKSAALFVKVLDRLLEDFRKPTLIVMVGLMIGSLRALWPWRDDEVGAVFARVLEDAGVYKRTDAGRAAFLRFAAAIGNTL